MLAGRRGTRNDEFGGKQQRKSATIPHMCRVECVKVIIIDRHSEEEKKKS